MQRSAESLNRHARAIASGDLSVRHLVGVDESKLGFEANATAMKASDKTTGYLLDMVA